MLSVQELIDRPIIRHDQPEEYLNKLNDDEIKLVYEEVEKTIMESGINKDSKIWDAAVKAKIMEVGVIYDIFKTRYEQL